MQNYPAWKELWATGNLGLVFNHCRTKQTSQSGGGGEQQDSRKFAILGKDKPDARDRKQFYSRVETFSISLNLSSVTMFVR